MQKASLPFILLLLGILFLQAESMTKRSHQFSLTNQKSTANLLTSFGFPGLVEISGAQGQAQKIANLFAYYIDGRVLANTVSSLFYKAQTNNVLTYDQLQNVLTYEGVEKSQLDRLLNLITLDQNNVVDYSEFSRVADVIFNEALSVVTWIYMTKNPIISPTDRVDGESVEDTILKLFKKIEHLYPSPRCEEIEYLFQQADEDGDGLLDIEEFHHLFSIFLKYYKSGIQNNDYAGVIFEDDLYSESSDSDESETEEYSYGLTEGTKSSAPEPTYDSATEGTEPSGSVTESDVTIRSEPESTEFTPSGSDSAETESEPEATESSPPATEDDTFGWSYGYPKTESEPEATESTPSGSNDSAETESEPEATEPTPSGSNNAKTESASELEATESTPSGSNDSAETESEPEATESSPPQTEDDTFGFSYYYPTEDSDATEVTKPSETEETETDDEASEPTGAVETQQETESEPTKSSEPTGNEVTEETESEEASGKTGNETTNGDEETEETERTQSEDDDSSDESDEDDNSDYSYHYSSSSKRHSRGHSSGNKKYTSGSYASSKFSWHNKRNGW